MFWLELAAFPCEVDLERDSWRQWRDSVSPGVLESRAELWSCALVARTGSWLQSVSRWVAKWIKTTNVRVSQQGDNFFVSKSVDSVPEVPLHLADSSAVACSAPRTAPRKILGDLMFGASALKKSLSLLANFSLKRSRSPQTGPCSNMNLFSLCLIVSYPVSKTVWVSICFLEEQELSTILHKIVIRYHYFYGRQPCSFAHSTVGVQYLPCAGHCPN